MNELLDNKELHYTSVDISYVTKYTRIDNII